jgi:hypothetical protein
MRFRPYIGPLLTRMSRNFQLKRMLRSCDIELLISYERFETDLESDRQTGTGPAGLPVPGPV